MQGVTEDGTAKAAAIPGYAVAGKTGTAQKVTNGRYDSSKFLSSFVGIVPADNPRLVVAVMIDEPQGIHYGGVVAAPAFKAIAEGALRYLGVAPSSPSSLMVADKKDKRPIKPEPKPAAAEAEPDSPGLDEPAAVVASEQGDSDDSALAEDDEAPGTATSSGPVAFPDFTGMSMGEAIRAARKAGVELVPSGSGVAASQSPKPGPASAGTVCRVSFQRRGG